MEEPSTEILECRCFQLAKSQVCFHFECQGSVPYLNKKLSGCVKIKWLTRIRAERGCFGRFTPHNMLQTAWREDVLIKHQGCHCNSSNLCTVYLYWEHHGFRGSCITGRLWSKTSSLFWSSMCYNLLLTIIFNMKCLSYLCMEICCIQSLSICNI